MTDQQILPALISAAFIGLTYLSVLIFLLGVGLRLYLYTKTAVPLKIATTPGPKTAGGVAARLAADVAFFPNLFHADKALWLGAWVFHVFLALILFRHLRYFLYPVPGIIVDWQTISVTAGFLFPLPVLYLFWRRPALPRTPSTSGLPDSVALLFLSAIA